MIAASSTEREITLEDLESLLVHPAWRWFCDRAASEFDGPRVLDVLDGLRANNADRNATLFELRCLASTRSTIRRLLRLPAEAAATHRSAAEVRSRTGERHVLDHAVVLAGKRV